MSRTLIKLAVLYADVSGSTRLYEQFGDEVALADISACLAILRGVVEKHEGNVIKSIGDEIMCAFERPEQAAEAAMEMNRALREASKAGHFKSGDLHIKAGWHYGNVRFRENDLVGEAPALAQQVIKMAKRNEILSTKKSIEELSVVLKCKAVFIDKIKADHGRGNIEVHALPWDEEDGEATMAGSSREIASVMSDRGLMLHYKDKDIELGQNLTHCRIGRGKDNELIVKGELTSRHHGEIYYRHGRFHLVDMSTNGTAVLEKGKKTVRVRRDEKILRGEGIICFGGKPKRDPGAAVHYKCIKATVVPTETTEN